MVVENDPVFGGGHLVASGPGSHPAQDFELVADDKTFKVESAGDVQLAAGDSFKRYGAFLSDWLLSAVVQI
jgi:hypothetical protein